MERKWMPGVMRSKAGSFQEEGRGVGQLCDGKL